MMNTPSKPRSAYAGSLVRQTYLYLALCVQSGGILAVMGHCFAFDCSPSFLYCMATISVGNLQQGMKYVLRSFPTSRDAKQSSCHSFSRITNKCRFEIADAVDTKGISSSQKYYREFHRHSNHTKSSSPQGQPHSLAVRNKQTRSLALC